jgi:glycosyltransferase involved in cell wall biosynthesis
VKRPGITVVIPSIPPRAELLRRATDSAHGAAAELARFYGTMVPVEIVTVLDERREGAAKTRHRGLLEVETEHVAFLDDDDVMHPDHLHQLYGAALEFQADYVWSRFQIIKEDHVWAPCDVNPDICPVEHHRRVGVDWRMRHLITRSDTVQGPVFLGEKAFSQWNDDDPCQTTITTLVRTELALAAGGFAQFEDDGSTVDGNRRGEDHEFTLRCRAAGGQFRHVPRVTWDWYHHSANTSGMPTW